MCLPGGILEWPRFRYQDVSRSITFERYRERICTQTRPLAITRIREFHRTPHTLNVMIGQQWRRDNQVALQAVPLNPCARTGIAKTTTKPGGAMTMRHPANVRPTR